jgi:hypothetical protein
MNDTEQRMRDFAELWPPPVRDYPSTDEYDRAYATWLDTLLADADIDTPPAQQSDQ